MRLVRTLAAATLTAAAVGAALLGQTAAVPSATLMADAATAFLAGLPAELKAKAAMPYDSPERLKWHFVPLQDKERRPTRKGVRLEELSADQRAAALAMLKAGTSEEGYKQATAIMGLEEVLAGLEKKGAMVRNPGWYFVSVFGEPSKTGAWSWRFEGHHLSLNYTLDKGRVVSATPAVFASNPAVIKAGPHEGFAAIPGVDELARDLLRSLDDEQRKVALRDKQFPEVEPTPAPKVGPPVGLPGAKMTPAQKEGLTKLLRAYTGRFPADVAASELQAALADGIDAVHFAYAGSDEPGKPHTYRVQSKGFVIEFLNVQADSAGNPANHIHSAWRRLPGDFGTAGQ